MADNCWSCAKQTDIINVNGRTGFDRNTGEHTCLNYNGRSVVDYMIVAVQCLIKSVISELSVCWVCTSLCIVKSNDLGAHFKLC